MIRWLGGLPDLADTAAVTGALGLKPHPMQQFWEHDRQRELNYTIISEDSSAPRSLLFVDDRADEPNGYAAQPGRDSRLRCSCQHRVHEPAL